MKIKGVKTADLADAPIYFRGRPLTAKKHEGKTDGHFCSESDAYERLKPYFKMIGITRLGNITGLDRIGVPVYNAIKPSLENFSVAHGKGLTSQAARISAMMESMERYHGGLIDLPVIKMSYRELEKKYNVIPLENLAIAKDSLFGADKTESWVLGWDIVNQREVAVPNYQVKFSRVIENGDLISFQLGSNGLSAALDLLEAITQAVTELFERDAITCHAFISKARGGVEDFPVKYLRPQTIKYPRVTELLNKIEKAGVQPILFDCEVDTEVPAYNCYLFDRVESKAGITHGMGAGLDQEHAMIRAITEAIQARAVFRSGCRDVYFSDSYRSYKLFSDKIIESFDAQNEAFDHAHKKCEATPTFQGDLHTYIKKLKKIGLNQIIVFDISRPEFNGACAAVRVIIPGLEGYMLPFYSPGKRALEYFRGKEF